MDFILKNMIEQFVIEDKIKECILELEQYQYYSPLISRAIKELKEIQRVLKDLNEENLDEALKRVVAIHQGSLTYSTYLPRTVSNLEFLEEWLEKRIGFPRS